MGVGVPRVDPDRCIGAGQCELAAPNTFEIDDDGVSVVVDPAGDEPSAVADAVANCPARAVTHAP